MTPMRAVLADDHPLFLDGLASLLRARGWEIAGTAADGAEAVELTRRLHPDVVFMDLMMPGMGGLEATRVIASELEDVRVVIVTVSEGDANLFQAIRDGAHGYLVKNTPPDEFAELLEALERGEAPLSRRLAGRIMAHLTRGGSASAEPWLTPREEEVLRFVAEGMTNRDIAEGLSISVPTVKFHVTNILTKLHLENRAQAAAYAHRRGLTTEDDDTLPRS
jgi:DNA-binding NarL/FixJ family response regulator